MPLDRESLKGLLLIASPSIFDPNFRQAVVLIAEHNEEGAMGVVLNRPTEATIGDVAPQLEVFADADETIYAGGPVQPSALIVLGQFIDPSAAALPILGDIGFVGIGTELDEVERAVHQSRVFAGHAGWGPDQLQAEMESEDWIVQPATHDDVFSHSAAELWTTLLQRMGGEYALMARMPFDPSVN